MLSNFKGLIFPKLKYQKSVYLKGKKENEVSLFTLDWKTFDEKLCDSIRYWWDTCGQGKEGVLFPGMQPQLPESYGYVRDQIYALSPNYLKEIRRVSCMSVLEWNLHRGFDTIIREECLKPAQAFVKTGFMLLSDCVYDTHSNYFNRQASNNRIINTSVLTYLFWVHQVGRGMPIHLSGLQEFAGYYPGSVYKKTYEDFIMFEKSIPNRFGIADLNDKECSGIKMPETKEGYEECISGEVQAKEPE